MFEWLSRKKIASNAQDLADHLKLVEHVRALQDGQRDIADAIARVGERLNNIDAQLLVIQANVKYDALKETQTLVNSVQGEFYKQLSEIAIRVDRLDRASPLSTNGYQPPPLEASVVD